MMWWPFNGWWTGIGFLFMIVFWGIVIALIVWAIKRLGSNSGSNTPTPPPQQTPLDIVKARYARGEISKEQFEQIKKDLS